MIKDIKIPETLNDLNLGQWQEIIKLDSEDYDFYMRRVLSVIYDIRGVNLEDIKSSDIDIMMDSVRNVIVQQPEFKNRFSLGETEYGFIPNFDDITFGELIDMDTYSKQDDYDKLMSILYRPIVKRQLGNRYAIEKYISSWNMKEIPLGIALGAVSFFLTLGSQLISDTLNCLTEQEKTQVKKLDLQKNGGGSVQSMAYAMGGY